MRSPVVMAPRYGVTPLAAASGGVPVTPGKGPSIATDNVSGLEYQVVKLALGGSGAAVLVEPGQKPAAESFPVVLADDTVVNVEFPPGLATDAEVQLLSKEATATKEVTLQAGVDLLTDLKAGQVASNSSLDAIEAGQASALALWTTMEGQQDTTNALLNDIKTNTASAGGAPPATATVTSVAAAVASTQLLAANAARKGATLYNDSPAELLVKLGTGAAPTSFTLSMLPGSYYELPYGYVGRVDGIWATAAGNARVTELTV